MFDSPCEGETTKQKQCSFHLVLHFDQMWVHGFRVFEGFWEHVSSFSGNFMEHFWFKLLLVQCLKLNLCHNKGSRAEPFTWNSHSSWVRTLLCWGAPTQNQCLFSGQIFPKFWPIQRVFHGKKKDPNLPDFEGKKISNYQIFMISSSR